MAVPSTPHPAPPPATDLSLVNRSAFYSLYPAPSIDETASLHVYISNPGNVPLYTGQEYSGWYWREMVSAWQLTKRHPNAVPAETLIDWFLDRYPLDDSDPTEQVVSRLNEKLQIIDVGVLISQPFDWNSWVNVLAPFVRPWSLPRVIVMDARAWEVDGIRAAMERARGLRAEDRYGRAMGWKVEVLVRSLFQREEAERAAGESGVDVEVVLMGPVNVWEHLAMVNEEVF